MSHYTVAVITKDGDYEKALAPYDENKRVEKYIKKTREDLIKECKETKEKYENSTNEDHRNWYFRSSWSKIDFTSDETIVKSFLELMGDENYDKDGNEWSTYNPKSKWDSYSVGGRWCGYLKLKHPIENNIKSEPSLMSLLESTKETIDSLSDELKADHAQVKDIDFTPDESEEAYYKRIWEINVEDSPLREDEKEEDYTTLYNKNYYLERYGDKETYIKDNTTFNTYALIYNGEWIEPGRMGWFGQSDATKNGYMEYRKRFNEIISNLDPEDWITVVDCHI